MGFYRESRVSWEERDDMIQEIIQEHPSLTCSACKRPLQRGLCQKWGCYLNPLNKRCPDRGCLRTLRTINFRGHKSKCSRREWRGRRRLVKFSGWGGRRLIDRFIRESTR